MFVGFGKVTSKTKGEANATVRYCFKVYKVLQVIEKYGKYTQHTQNLSAQKSMQYKFRFAFNELVSVGTFYTWHSEVYSLFSNCF